MSFVIYWYCSKVYPITTKLISFHFLYFVAQRLTFYFFLSLFRYDARLLLDNTLPISNPKISTGTSVSQQPDSPTGGWSDLPSDTEDTFFFSPDETEDFRKEKRRRLLEQTRAERLKARMEEDQVDDEENQEEEDVWGGSDEEVRVIFLFY